MPADISVLTPDFLSAVLGRPVRALRVERIGTDRGFASTVLRLTLDREAPPGTVVAKLGVPGDQELAREVAFYRDVAPVLRAPAPACQYAGPTPAGGPLLLLGDLTDASPGDALAGAAPADVRLVLASMAAVWRHGDGPPADLLPRWGADAAGLMARQERYGKRWRAVRGQLEAVLPAPVWRLGELLCTRLSGVLAELAAGPPTVVHGDLHLDNVLFRPSGAPTAAVLDWAAVCRGPAALDVFPFVAASLSPDDHRQHAGSLVDELASELAMDGAAKGRFVDDGRRALLHHFTGVVGWLHRPPTANPRETPLRHAALRDGRLAAAMQHWDVARVLTG